MDVGNIWNPRGYPRADHQDPTVLNRIMLKFRPIAPKPVAAAGSGSGSAPEENKADAISKRRSKRKYVRVKKKKQVTNRCSQNNIIEEEKGGGEEERENHLLTLQLLPESSGSSAADSPKKMLSFSLAEEKPPCSLWWINNNNNNDDDNFDNHRNSDVVGGGWPEQVDRRMALRVVESWVMVEGMTNTWYVDGGALGRTDMEKMKNLEVDTCPGMISDGQLDRVQWVNPAYRRMVDPLHGGEVPAAEVVARLVVKDNHEISITSGFSIASNFTCTVRVMYTRESQKLTQITMPCDVWKMDFGGFAWRFDAKAALSLGR